MSVGQGAMYKSLVLTIFLSIFVMPVQAFVIITNAGKPAKWENNEVTYELINVPNLFVDAIQESFRAWENVDGVQLRFIRNDAKGRTKPSSRDGKNSISFVSKDWTSLPFSPPSNALAVTLSSFDSSTGAIVDADIYFNADNFDWAVIQDEEDYNKVDVQNIATHEIGHMIGLDHSSIALFESDPELYEATMFYASGRGEISRRTPQVDDERGVRSLYGTSFQEAAVIESVEEIYRYGNIRVYRVRGKNFSEMTSFVLTANSYSVYDVPARYRTILSSTEAEVELNLSGFYVGKADLLAFNDPSQISAYALNIKTGQAIANSTIESNSGGGCSLSSTSNADPDMPWILALGFILLMAIRVRMGMRSR